jgi:hypothetical protein
MTTSLTTQPARGLALQSFDDAFRFAKMVAASEFAPKDFRGKPESCLLAIQRSRALADAVAPEHRRHQRSPDDLG